MLLLKLLKKCRLNWKNCWETYIHSNRVDRPVTKAEENNIRNSIAPRIKQIANMSLYNSPTTRSKTLMEMLLARKIEMASSQAQTSRLLLRTDSMDSVSSIGSCTSSMLGEDVCRCDDCILGIADLYLSGSLQSNISKKKVIKWIRH